jgi:glycosyltransferase involved in cell wall biosynthesis
MTRGHCPEDYLFNPAIRKPIETIYQEIDAFTFEIQPDDTDLFFRLNAVVLLPPLVYDGVFLKGIVYSVGMDALIENVPGMTDLFHTIAHSGCSSYPWSLRSDAYFSVYPNPHREAWFRQTHPERADKILIPFETPENFNEYNAQCRPLDQRPRDLICVSRFDFMKNLPFIAHALKVYRKKYPQPIRMTLVPGVRLNLNGQHLNDRARMILGEMESILGHVNDYVDFYPVAQFPHELMGLYAESKAFLLGSLMEGKNRSLHEAMACNVPAVCLKAFNQYTRGDSPIFPDGAGDLAPFHPEGLADTLHHVLENREHYEPRRAFLKHYGRKNVTTTCIDAFPYYVQHLPGYTPGNHLENVWLNLATQHLYGMSLHDFLYKSRKPLRLANSLEEIRKMEHYYRAQCFGNRAKSIA